MLTAFLVRFFMKNILNLLIATGIFAVCSANGMENNRNNRNQRSNNQREIVNDLSSSEEEYNDITIEIPRDLLSIFTSIFAEEEDESIEDSVDLNKGASSCNPLIPHLYSNMLAATAKSVEGSENKVVPSTVVDIANSFLSELAPINELDSDAITYTKGVVMKIKGKSIPFIAPAIILPDNDELSVSIQNLADKYNGFLPYNEIEDLLSKQSAKNFLRRDEVSQYIFPGFLNRHYNPFCAPGTFIKIGAQHPFQVIDKVITLKDLDNFSTYDQLSSAAAEYAGNLPVNILLENSKTREAWIKLLTKNKVLIRNSSGIGPNFVLTDNFNIQIEGHPLIQVVAETIVLPENNNISSKIFEKLQTAERYGNSVIPKISGDDFLNLVLDAVEESKYRKSSRNRSIIKAQRLLEATPSFLKTAPVREIVERVRPERISPIGRGREFQFVQFQEHKFQLVNGVKLELNPEMSPDRAYNELFPQLLDVLHRDLCDISSHFDEIFEGVQLDPHYRGIPSNMPMELRNWRDWKCAPDFEEDFTYLEEGQTVKLRDGTEVIIEEE